MKTIRFHVKNSEWLRNNHEIILLFIFISNCLSLCFVFQYFYRVSTFRGKVYFQVCLSMHKLVPTLSSVACLLLIFDSSIFLPLSDICFLGIFPSPNFCLLFNFHLFLMISASCWHFIINLHHISADHSDSPTKSFRSCFWNKEVFMLLKVEMIRSEAKEGVILDCFIHQLCPEIVTRST